MLPKKPRRYGFLTKASQVNRTVLWSTIYANRSNQDGLHLPDQIERCKMGTEHRLRPMTEPSLPLRDSFLLSPRTANYIAARIREGDKFDYSKWLRRVREGEAQAKQGLGTFISKDVVAADIGNQTGTSDGIWPNPKLMTKAVSIPRALRQAHRAPKNKHQKSAFGTGLRRSVMRGTYFRQVVRATPYMSI